MRHFLFASICAAGLLGACLSVPSEEAPMCVTTDDCDGANGEVCESGTCYGNPPAGPFAAFVTPPAERTDLVSGEHPMLPITQDGWLGTIQLPEAVTFTGTVRARCDLPLVCESDTSLGAIINVERPAQFAGGPTFRSSVTIETNDDDTFSLVLPRTGASDRGFTVTIVPTGRDNGPSGTPTTAQLLPPLRTEITVAENVTGKVIEIGGAGLQSVTGYLRTPTGGGLAGYRVVAMGHWDPLAPLQEVSTVDYTSSDGKFTIVLSSGLVETVEIVARPHAANMATLPALHMPGLLATVNSTNQELAMPADLGKEITVSIPVQTIGGSGGPEPVIGARVVVSARIDGVGDSYTTFSAEGTTDESGNALVKLLDGARIRDAYRISITPPASATASAMYDEEFTMGNLAMFVLPRRVALRGLVRDFEGKPLKDVAVTARPSLRFTWSLPPAAQAFVSGIPAATAVTPETGEFVLFVDSYLAGVWGYYDLAYETTEKSRAPNFVETIELPRDGAPTVDLPDRSLPDAAFVHGEVVDPLGEPVKDAEVKLFQIETDLSLCEEVPHAPQRCPVPARLVGRGTADGDGHVRLTLPR